MQSLLGSYKHKQGFTLMELLITMSVVAILSILGLASSAYFTEKNEQQRIIDEIRTAVQYAKIQAIHLGKPVYLVPFDSAMNWSKGLSLIAVNKKSSQQEVLYQWQWHHPRWHLVWSGINASNKISLSNNPITAISNGTFHLTNIRTKQSVDLILNRLGRVRVKE